MELLEQLRTASLRARSGGLLEARRGTRCRQAAEGLRKSAKVTTAARDLTCACSVSKLRCGYCSAFDPKGGSHAKPIDLRRIGSHETPELSACSVAGAVLGRMHLCAGSRQAAGRNALVHAAYSGRGAESCSEMDRHHGTEYCYPRPNTRS